MSRVSIYDRIAVERCENCDHEQEFTLKSLAQTMDLVTIQNGVVTYEGTWRCDHLICGFINSSVGEVSL